MIAATMDTALATLPPLRLFGAPQWLDDQGEPRPLPPERRHQLVAWLALRKGWAGRPELAALLWPEHEGRLAATNLRKALHRLQDSPLGAALESQGQALRLHLATDVAAFEAAVAAGELARAVALRCGELLEGYDDPANEAWTLWLQFERERLRTAWQGAALALLAGEGLDAAAAVALSAKLVAADALDETALGAHLRALATAGQIGAARQAYRSYVARLRSELGVEPGTALRTLHDGLAAVPTAGGRGPPRRADAADHAAIDDSFIGRAGERRRIEELLAQPECSVLVLLGPGGVGKSTLATHALRGLARGYADGGAFVAQEDAASAADVGARIAGELGIGLSGAAAPLVQVVRALQPRRMLLVLDNIEQIAAEPSWLQALQRGCPRLKLLLTSRVRIALPGVWTLPVEGLPYPEPEDDDRAEAFDAVRLFVRAARRVEPAFHGATEAHAIARICRQVEGMPLALELAASFVRLLSCRAIADELADGTELLAATDPARPARQASLEAVFDRSWRLLTAAERAALARLALFRGGFTPMAARQAAGVSLPVLAALADKSLLRKEGERCHLHPLIQQLALPRLGTGEERTAAATAHAQHYLGRVALLAPRLRHAEEAPMREVDVEIENLRAAWQHACEAGLVRALRDAARPLAAYFNYRGRAVVGLGWLQMAEASASVRDDEALAAVVAVALGLAQFRLDRYDEAMACGQRAHAFALQHGDDLLAVGSAKVIAGCHARQGRHEESACWFHEVQQIAERIGDTTSAAEALSNLGHIAKLLGRLDESVARYREALLLNRRIGNGHAETNVLNSLGVVHVLRREFDAAREAYAAAGVLAERLGLGIIRSMLAINLGEAALRQGDHAAAALHARQGRELADAAGNRRMVVEAMQLEACVAIEQRDLDEARRLLATSTEVALAVRDPTSLTHTVTYFAELLEAQGDVDVAVQVLAFALAQPGLVGLQREETEERLARWRARLGAEVSAPWPGPPLQALARAIVAEAALAHAPLIAALRAGLR